MHDRHVNRERYFNEQVFTTEKFVIPYIKSVKKIETSSIIMEIGCGEGGNLKPFLDLGCKCIGIDMAEMKIENGRNYFSSHPNVSNIEFVSANIYDVTPTEAQKADVVILRDVIEHIYNQEEFVLHLRKFLKEDGIVFFAYPPWRMPFGGHQQVLANKFWSKAPYWHLLPRFIVKGILSSFKLHSAIPGMMEILDTGISINRFKKVIKIGGFNIEKETFYLINPNYEVKFKLKTRAIWSIFNIPHLRDFYTTTHYCIVK
jgi:SAM-dependent methyltransferase